MARKKAFYVGDRVNIDWRGKKIKGTVTKCNIWLTESKNQKTGRIKYGRTDYVVVKYDKPITVAGRSFTEEHYFGADMKRLKKIRKTKK